ncbi:MAG: LPS export ABC transporter periplasmic protein LptC [Parvibaculaceae bacterium]
MTGPRETPEQDTKRDTKHDGQRGGQNAELLTHMTDGLYGGREAGSTGPTPRVGRHSHFVGAMKIVLPLTALALLGTVLFYSGIFSERDSLDISFKEIKGFNTDLRMVSPRITGLDKSGEPYLVTADTATQDKEDPTHVALDNVEADLKLKDDDSWISLKSTSGQLDTDQQHLTLQQTIDVYMSSGYEFHGTEGTIDFKTGSFTSNAPVEGHGPAGTLRADSMTADKEGQKLIFKGRVKTQFYGKE